MNTSVHILSGGLLGIALEGKIGYLKSGLFILSSVLPDMDHYLEYVIKNKKAGFREAYNFFKKNKHSPKLSLNVLHTGEIFLVFVLVTLAVDSKVLMWMTLGYAFHMLLDFLQAACSSRLNYRWWSIYRYWKDTK